MNRQRHRLVFNRARGLLMAVAETATRSTCASGQSGRSGAGAAPVQVRVSTWRLAPMWTWGLVSWAILALPCAAQITVDNGVAFARAHALRPGVALTAPQMAQLTSDTVWLVEQTVTLPDGRTTRALVPQLYARGHDSGPAPSGALLAGRAIDIQISGDLTQSGTIQARDTLLARTRNLRNLGGRIAGATVALDASSDLENIGGQIRADQRLLLVAGQDLRIASTTAATANAQGARTAIDRVASLQVAAAEGQISVQVGRDVQIAAAEVRSEGALAVHAGRDLSVATLDLLASESVRHDAANYRRESHRTQAGSTLQARGDLTLQAGNDLTARAASVSSANGALTAQAGRDLLIAAGESRVQLDEASRQKSRGLLSTKTIATQTHLDQTTAQASTFNGRTLEVGTGRDLRVVGSEAVSDAGTLLMAGRDLSIEAATETRATRDERSVRRVRRSGAMGSGGVGFTVGKQSESSQQVQVITSAAGSRVGSVNGDVQIRAGAHYRQVGSDLLAPRGDIDVAAQHVDIREARETEHFERTTQSLQSGLSVGLSNPVVTAAQTVNRVQAAVRESKDARSQALGALTQGLALYEAGAAAADDPSLAGGVTVAISLGSRRSDSRHTQTSDSAAGSRVPSGGDVRLRAAGAAQASDLRVQGSQVTAAGAVDLQADNAVLLLAARNLSNQQTQQSSSGAAVGVSVGVSSAGVGVNVTASGSKASGRGEGADQIWTPTRVTAGTALRIGSGADTVLQGAVAEAPQVMGRIGGNLRVESLQDTARQTQQERSVSAGVTYGSGGLRAEVSGHHGKASMDHTSVIDPSGVVAGHGGFDLQVQGQTDLTGGLLASSYEAAVAGRNRLITSAITIRDRSNVASAQASSSGFAVSSDMLTRGKYGATKALGANTLLNASESTSSSGMTRSAVSAGEVIVTNEAAQTALTGQSGPQTIASLNRDTAHAHVGVARPDLDAVQRVVNAQRAIKEEAYRAVTVFTDEAYRSRFEVKPRLFRVSCRDGADCVNDPKQVVYTPATPSEVANAPAGAVIAVNGILNDEQRGAQLTYQNTEHLRRKSEESSDKPRDVYLMHIAPARQTLSELLGVAYEKITAESDYKLANFLGYTTAQAVHTDLLKSRGQLGTVSLAHSRGTLTQKAAFTILANTPDASGTTYSNPNLSIRGVGGATGVADYTSSGLAVLGKSDKRDQITFSYFSNDPVSTSRLAGGNPGVSTLSDLWQVWKTSNSMHSCYGSGAAGCTQVEFPVPGGPQGTPNGNAKLMRFVGGKLVAETELQKKGGQ